MTERVPQSRDNTIHVGGHELHRHIVVPGHPPGVVVFVRAPGEASRDASIARALETRGVATVTVRLIDSAADDAYDAVDAIATLTDRIVETLDWLRGDVDLGNLPIALVGSGPSTAAVLTAAARHPQSVAAIVCCDGQPDLAIGDIATISAPTLYVVGVGDDASVARVADWLLSHLASAHQAMSRRSLGDPLC